MSKAGTTQVRATASGFYRTLRSEGDIFEITGPVPKWCEAVGSKKEATKIQQEQKPTDLGYKVKHMPPGNFVVVDTQGNKASEVFKRDPSDTAKAKADATAEADRLNAGGQPAPVEPEPAPGITNPQDEPPVQEDEEEDSDLPDA